MRVNYNIYTLALPDLYEGSSTWCFIDETTNRYGPPIPFSDMLYRHFHFLSKPLL